jgi:hypothetical protein
MGDSKGELRLPLYVQLEEPVEPPPEEVKAPQTVIVIESGPGLGELSTRGFDI